MLGSLSPRSGANLYLFIAISSFLGQAFLKENQLCLGIIASGIGFVLRPAYAGKLAISHRYDEFRLATLAPFRFRALGYHKVGHSVVATGCGVLRLSSSISAGAWTPSENR